ncbi:MAG TPA: hypothetical protein VHK26_09975 [Methyloceanibacter sp.]|jgi:hypothetical protein|nr:hypothetical protein [Methyloceanibacter sp.]
MIEDARDAGADVEAPAAEFANGQSMESAALAGAAAIQRLVAECNTLRTRVSLQETELARLRSANESVRRRFALLHQRYVDLAKKILGHLEQFDSVIREAGQEAISENGRHENGGHEEPVILDQPAQDASGPPVPKPNGRDIASVLAQASRAPSR